MTRRVRLSATALGLFLALAPVGARATHCPDAFMFAGVATGVPDLVQGNDVRHGVNLAIAQQHCDPAGLSPAPGPFRAPRATHVWAGIAFADAASINSGTVTFNPGSATTSLSFAANPARFRFESQSVPMPTTATSATVSISYNSGGTKSSSITYLIAP